MEEPILYNGATLAKCELLARLQQHSHNFVVPTEDEIAAAIEAARVPWERGIALRFNAVPGDDDGLVEAPAPRRQRKPSLTKALREAKKAGISVAGATFTADGSVSLSFGEAAKSNGNELDQWLAGRHENPTKGH